MGQALRDHPLLKRILPYMEALRRKRIVLASGSPRRLQLLQMVGLTFHRCVHPPAAHYNTSLLFSATNAP